MDKFWIFAALATLLVTTQALQVELHPDYLNFDEYGYNDQIPDLNDKTSDSEEFQKLIDEITNDNDEVSDKKVADEIEMFINKDELHNLNVDSDDTLDDYQFEDNRSEGDEGFASDKKENEQKSEEIDPQLLVINDLAKEVEDLNKIRDSLDDMNEDGENEDLPKLPDAPIPINLDPEQEVAKEAVPIERLQDALGGSDEKQAIDEKENEQNSKVLQPLDINELEKAVKDSNEIKDLIGDIDDDGEKSDEDLQEQDNPVKGFYKDTDDIIDSNKNDEAKVENFDEFSVFDDDDDDLESMEDVIPEVSEESKAEDEVKEEAESDEKLFSDEDMKSFQEAFDDYAFKELFNIGNDSDRDVIYDTGDFDEIAKLLNDYDYFHLDQSTENKSNDTNVLEEERIPESFDSEEAVAKEPAPIQYLQDALEASDERVNPDAEMINQTVNATTNANQLESEKVGDFAESEPSKVDYEHLSLTEYEYVMTEFAANHSAELNVTSEDFDKHVAPVHITLDTEPTVITSPNYPNNYPTNNIVDWIFTGDGEGIELIITDFAVNGILGDYLLVKPGGVDSSGNEGLVFSYTLNSERRYRFMDVNRMFVRFEARPGMPFTKGFSFTVRMIRPRPIETDQEPNPEPIIRPAHSSITVNLGGTTLDDFASTQVEEEFRQIIADMATMYINANNIDPGLNTTSEVTQILSTALCFHNWPKFDSCVEVKFGVPLEYDDGQDPRLTEEDLTSMWSNYFVQDPFAARLRRLGVTEYQVPNDKRAMTIWLVIAAGVVISVAMLAFALWRFSCFEGYTRMPHINDTDSIQEKRNLDLYPTPHQTLPPLYGTEYKWAEPKFDDSTRVDMGGYANKNYLRDDMFDLESDDDVSSRNSNRNIRPSDMYV